MNTEYVFGDKAMLGNGQLASMHVRTQVFKQMAEILKPRTAQLTPSELEKLADTADNEVYGYVYDAPETTLPPQQQVDLFKDIVQAFDVECVRAPAASDECMREAVLHSFPARRLFQRLYPKVFASCTFRVVNADMEERLDKTRKISMYMLAERLYGEGDDDERAARAMCAGMRISMRDTREDDVKDGVELTRPGGDSDSKDSDTAAITPLNRDEFGETTVKQGQKW